MPQDHGKSIEEEFINRALQGFDEISNGIYRELGPSTGAADFTDQQQVDLASYTPYPDPAERARRAVSMFQSGSTLEQVTDELYPRLRPLIELAGTGIRERISYAKQLRNKVDKRVPTFQELLEREDQMSPGPNEQSVLDELPKMEDGSPDPLFQTVKPMETLHPMIPDDGSATQPMSGPTAPHGPGPEAPPTPPVNSLYPTSQGPIPATPPMNLLGG